MAKVNVTIACGSLPKRAKIPTTGTTLGFICPLVSHSRYGANRLGASMLASEPRRPIVVSCETAMSGHYEDMAVDHDLMVPMYFIQCLYDLQVLITFHILLRRSISALKFPRRATGARDHLIELVRVVKYCF